MVERIQDLNLPNSNITKIIRDSLPADVNMDKGNFIHIIQSNKNSTEMLTDFFVFHRMDFGICRGSHCNCPCNISVYHVFVIECSGFGT